MPTPRESLVAFSQEQISMEAVFRMLAEHDGWYVPAPYAIEFLNAQDTELGNMILFSPENLADPGQLILFTDSVAAHRAEGQPIGYYCSAFSGARIFQTLGSRYQKVMINPTSPVEETFYLKPDAFPLAQLWGQVVELERLLDNATSTTIPYAQLAAHPGFLLLINEERAPILSQLKGIDGQYAMVFTAPDKFQHAVSQQPPEQQAQLKHATVNGVSLFGQLQSFELDGVLINRSTIIRRGEFQQVLMHATV